MRAVLRSLLQGIAATLLVRGLHEALLGARILHDAALAVVATLTTDPELALRTTTILTASFNLMVADVVDGTAFFQDNLIAYAAALTALVTSPLLGAFEAVFSGGLRGFFGGVASAGLFCLSWYPFRYESIAKTLRRKGLGGGETP